MALKLLRSTKFNREYRKFVRNQPLKARVVIETLNKFVNTPSHPSLNLEKLKGTKIWTIRIDRGNRIFFTWTNDKTAYLLDVGKHDKYRMY